MSKDEYTQIIERACHDAGVLASDIARYAKDNPELVKPMAAELMTTASILYTIARDLSPNDKKVAG